MKCVYSFHPKAPASWGPSPHQNLSAMWAPQHPPVHLNIQKHIKGAQEFTLTQIFHSFFIDHTFENHLTVFVWLCLADIFHG